MLAGGLIFIAVMIGVQDRYPATFGAGVPSVLSLVSALGAVVGAVLRVYTSLEPLFCTANTVAVRIEEKRQANAQKRCKKHNRLADLEKEIAETTAKRQALLADAARFRAAGPEQVLDFFLRESETTLAFEGSLGVVSHVRRAFEQLDAIFREAQEETRAPPHDAKFDRIVLYIDDLDRCNSKQVVEVLEAVHLLLAFPLFVVVVGVDSRWLEQSLLEFYKDKLRDTKEAPTPPDGHPGAQKSVPHTGQATVHDFLEKIFHIPVRLRRLSALPERDYARFIRQAAGPVTYSDPDNLKPEPEPNPDGRFTIDPLDVEIPPADRPAGAKAEQVRLKPEEVDMIRQLGPIVGKTPRAVKRFVNLYRLVRGMRRGPDLDSFIKSENPRPHAAYQFWLAVDVGLSLIQARRLRSVVAQLDPDVSEATVLLKPLKPGDGLTIEFESEPDGEDRPAYWDELAAFWEAVPQSSRAAIRDALQAALTVLRDGDGLLAMQQALEDTRRFSSDRY